MQTYAIQPYRLLSIIIENNIGVKLEVMPQMQDMVIYQDIFGVGMYGYVALIDSTGTYEALGLHGDELVTIIVQDNVENIERKLEFKSYAISPKINKQGHTQKIYAINFCLAEMFLDLMGKATGILSTDPNTGNTTAKISTLWTNLYPRGVAEKPLNVDASLLVDNRSVAQIPVNTTTTPFRYIRKLLPYITSKISDFPDALFFENFRGYNIDSLSNMNFDPPTSGYVAGERYNVSPDINFFNILDYTETEWTDTLEKTEQGVFSSVTYSHDIIHKKWSMYKLDYVDAHDMMYTSGYPLVNETSRKKFSSAPGKIKFRPVSSFSYGDTAFDTGGGSQNTITTQLELSHQFAIKNLLTGPKIHMLVHGNMEINVGDNILVEIPTTGKEPSYKENTQTAGTCIVTAVAHVFSNEQYHCHVECSKTGIDKPIMGDVPKINKTKVVEQKVTSPQDEKNVVTGEDKKEDEKDSVATSAFPSKRGNSNNDNSIGTFPTSTSVVAGGGGGGGGGSRPSSGVPIAIPELPVVGPAPVPIQVDDTQLFPSGDVLPSNIGIAPSQEFNDYVSQNTSLLEQIRSQDAELEFSDSFVGSATRDERQTLLSNLQKRQKINEEVASYIKKREAQKGCN